MGETAWCHKRHASWCERGSCNSPYSIGIMSSEYDMKTKEEYLAIVERTLDETLPKETERPAVLSEAMRYAVGTGGKRIRPLICLAAAEAVGGSAVDAAYPAAAIEMLHNYTLVHDDLPAMDNDTLRRGKPTVWTKYGHANAILVGDALQALAFRTAARAPRNVAAIVGILGEHAVLLELACIVAGIDAVDEVIELLDILLAHELCESVYELLIVVNGLLYLGKLFEGLGQVVYCLLNLGVGHIL